MNRIAEFLFIIGWLTIAGGIVLGIANYETVVGYETGEFSIYDEEPITDTSWETAAIYILAGLIWGIMIFGFAEIIRILDDKRSLAKKSLNELVNINSKLNGDASVENNSKFLETKQISKGNDSNNESNAVDYSPLQSKESAKTDRGLKGIIDEAVNGNKK